MGSVWTNIAVLVMLVVVLQNSTIEARKTKRLVTYNTFLLEWYPTQTIRRNLIIQRLSELDADAVCLQEVFYSNGVKAIVNTMSAQYPYSFSALHRPDGSLPAYDSESPPCSMEEISNVQQCMLSQCIAFASDRNKFANCIIEECTMEILELDPDCLICLFFSPNPLSQAYCANTTITDNVINVYGLLFLSKEKITYNAVSEFNGDVEKRVERRAQLKLRVKNIKGMIACMHLSANLSLSFREPNLPQINSFEDMNTDQIKTILNMYKKERNLILMGDFNTGPPKPRPGLDAEFPKSYHLIRNECLMESDLNKCTFCSDNPFQVARGNTNNVSIDHIFMRGHILIGRKRVLDETTPFVLSDHYGLEVTALVRK